MSALRAHRIHTAYDDESKERTKKKPIESISNAYKVLDFSTSSCQIPIACVVVMCSVHSSVRVLSFSSERRWTERCRWLPQKPQENYTKYHLFGRWFPFCSIPTLQISPAHSMHSTYRWEKWTQKIPLYWHFQQFILLRFNCASDSLSYFHQLQSREFSSFLPENFFFLLISFHFVVCIPSMRPDRRFAPSIPTVWKPEKILHFFVVRI